MRFHAGVPLDALARLVHLPIPRLGIVLGRARRADNAGICNGTAGNSLIIISTAHFYRLFGN
jgi:hypothetical protein